MTLSEYMTKAGLNDRELSERLGVDRSCITRVRQGVRAPSFSLLKKIHNFTDGNVSVDDFDDTTISAQ